ncbi:MAG TPA: hypothetical protein VMZ28_17940 [Kofleriaceae bacterium]|nr:hypothetical protein [Kofleriaceae bacterium]
MSYTAAKSRSILALSAVTLAFLGGCASGPRLQVVAATAPDSKLSRALVATVMYDLDIDECFQAHATWSKSAEPQRLALSVRAADGKVFIEKAQPGKASVLGARLAGCLYGRMAGWRSSGTGRVKLDIVAHATPAPVVMASFTPEE